MHSVRLEPTKLILVGTRTTYQATGDAGYVIRTTMLNQADAAIIRSFGAEVQQYGKL